MQNISTSSVFNVVSSHITPDIATVTAINLSTPDAVIVYGNSLQIGGDGKPIAYKSFSSSVSHDLMKQTQLIPFLFTKNVGMADIIIIMDSITLHIGEERGFVLYYPGTEVCCKDFK